MIVLLVPFAVAAALGVLALFLWAILDIAAEADEGVEGD